MRARVVAALERLFGDRGVDIGALKDDDDLSEHLEWDSMDIVDLGMEFERRLDAKLPEEVDAINTISRLVGFLS
ncbi:MAG: acyl carrier protein [Myxococcota bacterium]|nr:acyl carrier protein [Myxococcota bacterium]